MKGIIAFVLMTLFIVSAASAGQFGPPEPMADTGKFSLGLGYWLDRTKMKLEGDHTLRERSNQYYLQGNYTFLKDWEVYGRLGAADLDLYRHRDHSDGAEPYGTLGFKGVMYRYKNFAIGPFVDGSWYADHDHVAHDQWAVNLGVSAQYKIPVGSRDLTLYGGPFAYWSRAESDIFARWAPTGDDLKEKHNFGGFLGVKVPVVKQVFLTAEAQMKGRLGGGASISYAF
jgi:hypothetical protein